MLTDKSFKNLIIFFILEFLDVRADGYFENLLIANNLKSFFLFDQKNFLQSLTDVLHLVWKGFSKGLKTKTTYMF